MDKEEKRVIKFEDLKSACKQAGNVSYGTIPFGCGLDDGHACTEADCPIWDKLPVEQVKSHN